MAKDIGMADDLWYVYGTNPPISMSHILSAQKAMCADDWRIFDFRFAIAFGDWVI